MEMDLGIGLVIVKCSEKDFYWAKPTMRVRDYNLEKYWLKEKEIRKHYNFQRLTGLNWLMD